MIVRSKDNKKFKNSLTPIHSDRVEGDGGVLLSEDSLDDSLDGIGGEVSPAIAFIAGAYKAGKAYNVIPSDGSGDFTVSRSGSTAMTQNPDGTWRPALENEPRFTSDGGILVEGARTNLATHPRSFDNAAWETNDATIDDNDGAGYESPFVDSAGDNLLNAYKLKATANNGYIRLATPLTVTAGTSYANSIFIKRVAGTGDVSLIDINTADRVKTITSEWQRFDYVAAAAGTSGQIGVKLGTSGDEVLICHAQPELGADASSPIGGAEGSTQTRNADVIEVTGIGSLLPESGGIQFTFDAEEDFDLVIGETSVNNLSGIVKIKYEYSSTEQKLYIDGVLVDTATGTYDFSGMTFIELGHMAGLYYANAPIYNLIISQ